MARNLNLSNAAANAQADAYGALLNNGYLRIYDGSQPVSADTAVSGQTCSPSCASVLVAFGAAVNGVITANALTPEDSAPASGTATWYRALKSDGTTVMHDGTVGQQGTGTYDMELTVSGIVAGAEISIASFTHTVTK